LSGVPQRRASDPPRRALVLSLAGIGAELNGTAIRAYELARVLSAHTETTLAATGVEEQLPGLRCVDFARHDPRTLAPHLSGAGFVLAQPQWPLMARSLRRSGSRLVFDLYAPDPLEALEFLARSQPFVRHVVSGFAVDRLVDALRIGDHFICASESQRDLWLGAMLAERLIDPHSYDCDPSFRSVISVVPSGLPDEPPRAAPDSGIRARFPQIAESDRVVLWNGGLWNWLDPETAIRGVAIARREDPSLRLVFMGASQRAPGQRASRDARQIATDLGLPAGAVLFNDRWVPYAERASWLLEADCALSCHVDHLETRFAFRTRLLDCFWAGLPVICTGGDTLAEEVDRHQVGMTVPQRDPDAVAAALLAVLRNGKPSYAERIARVAERYRWSRVAEPLVGQLTGSAPVVERRTAPRRPRHALRTAAYSSARLVLNRLGLGRDGLDLLRG
jgi:glycosyltransferase involved in cell wall biosynthesis